MNEEDTTSVGFEVKPVEMVYRDIRIESLEERITDIEKRIDRLVDAVSKSKRTKGI